MSLHLAIEGPDLSVILSWPESSGRLERKLSILNTDHSVLERHVSRAVALVNGNFDQEVYLIFGLDDKGNRAGQVAPDGSPLSELAVEQSQRRLDARLQQCKPPIVVNWALSTQEGRSVWVAKMKGRQRGTAHMTPTGTFPYRSGEDTYLAEAQTVAAWLAERPGQAPLKIEASIALPVYGVEMEIRKAEKWLAVAATTEDPHGYRIVRVWFGLSNKMNLFPIDTHFGSDTLPHLVTDHNKLQLYYDIPSFVRQLRRQRNESGQKVTITSVVLEDSAKREHSRPLAMPLLDPDTQA
jgi:hypothetical protein